MNKKTIKFLNDLLLVGRKTKNQHDEQNFLAAREKFKSALMALFLEQAITKDEYSVWIRMWRKEEMTKR